MALTNSPADVLRYALIAAGGGSLPSSGNAWPIAAWQESDLPDNFITLYDTSGNIDGRFQNNGAVQEHPGIQIRVRALNPSDGNTKIRDLLDIIDLQIRETLVTCNHPVGTGVSMYLIHNVSRKGTVLSLGKDTPTTKRALFTVNLTISLSQIS